MSEVSRDDIRHLSHLARLEMPEEDFDRYAAQLSSVVAYVAQLQQVDTANVSATHGITGMENVLAEDVHRSPSDQCSVDSEDLIKAAPLRHGKLIEVRAVLDPGEAS